MIRVSEFYGRTHENIEPEKIKHFSARPLKHIEFKKRETERETDKTHSILSDH